MFPPFIDSFGAQVNAVLINSVFGGFLTALFGAFVNAFITPLFKGIAAAIGIPT